LSTSQSSIDLPQRLRWRTQQQWPRSAIPSSLHSWLIDSGSLTGKLIKASNGHFRVQVLRQNIACPLAEESRKLGMKPRGQALIREVILLGLDAPWVFARSVVPLSTLTGRQKALRNLDNRPLGAFLFADPSMKRGPMEIARVPPDCFGTDRADSNDYLWGRRSMFYLDHKPLLVNEIFLSTFKPLQ